MDFTEELNIYMCKSVKNVYMCKTVLNRESKA